MNEKAWEDAQIGEDLGSIQYKLTPEDIQRKLLGTEDSNPWYTKESPFGGPIAPPLINSNDYARLYHSHFDHELSLHTKTEVEIINPIFLGKLITARGTIIDKYMRRGRKCVVIETIVTDEDGTEICRSKNVMASIKTFPEA